MGLEAPVPVVQAQGHTRAQAKSEHLEVMDIGKEGGDSSRPPSPGAGAGGERSGQTPLPQHWKGGGGSVQTPLTRRGSASGVGSCNVLYNVFYNEQSHATFCITFFTTSRALQRFV